MLSKFKEFCDDAVSEKLKAAYGSNHDTERLFDEVVQLANVDPVSYTHLDVYKRQIIFMVDNMIFGRRFRFRFHFPNLTNNRGRSESSLQDV